MYLAYHYFKPDQKDLKHASFKLNSAMAMVKFKDVEKTLRSSLLGDEGALINDTHVLGKL